MSDHQTYYPQYGTHPHHMQAVHHQQPVFMAYAAEGFEAVESKKRGRWRDILFAIGLVTGIGAIVFGAREASNALRAGREGRLRSAGALLAGGMVVLLLWFSLWQLLGGIFVTRFGAGQVYTNAESSAKYQLMVPSGFSHIDDAGLDNTQVFRYHSIGNKHQALLQVSTAYVGAVADDRRATVLAAFSDSQSAVAQSFLTALKTANNFAVLTAESFKQANGQSGTSGMLGNMTAVTESGTVLRGQLFITFGATDQYVLFMAADEPLWQRNSANWQSVLTSFAVQ